MDDPPSMHVFKGEAYLYEPVKNFKLCEELSRLVNLPLDVVAKVTNFTVLHDNDQ